MVTILRDYIEKIYYSAYKGDPLCGSTTNLTIPGDTDSFYPFCYSDCSSKENIYINACLNEAVKSDFIVSYYDVFCFVCMQPLFLMLYHF